jgi:hypothetical protein
MADCCRQEVHNDVISCQKVNGVEVVHILNFGVPSSIRLGAIRMAHFVTTTTEQSCQWVGLGWFGSIFFKFGGLGWVVGPKLDNLFFL